MRLWTEEFIEGVDTAKTKGHGLEPCPITA